MYRGLGASIFSGNDWCDPQDPIWGRLCGNLSTDAPYGDIRDQSWQCTMFPTLFPTQCRIPTEAEILGGDQAAGKMLSPESKQAATVMATDAVLSDCEAHPENYTQIPGSCSYKADYTGLWILGAAAAALLLLRR